MSKSPLGGQSKPIKGNKGRFSSISLNDYKRAPQSSNTRHGRMLLLGRGRKNNQQSSQPNLFIPKPRNLPSIKSEKGFDPHANIVRAGVKWAANNERVVPPRPKPTSEKTNVWGKPKKPAARPDQPPASGFQSRSKDFPQLSSDAQPETSQGQHPSNQQQEDIQQKRHIPRPSRFDSPLGGNDQEHSQSNRPQDARQDARFQQDDRYFSERSDPYRERPDQRYGLTPPRTPPRPYIKHNSNQASPVHLGIKDFPSRVRLSDRYDAQFDGRYERQEPPRQDNAWAESPELQPQNAQSQPSQINLDSPAAAQDEAQDEELERARAEWVPRRRRRQTQDRGRDQEHHDHEYQTQGPSQDDNYGGSSDPYIQQAVSSPQQQSSPQQHPAASSPLRYAPGPSQTVDHAPLSPQSPQQTRTQVQQETTSPLAASSDRIFSSNFGASQNWDEIGDEDLDFSAPIFGASQKRTPPMSPSNRGIYNEQALSPHNRRNGGHFQEPKESDFVQSPRTITRSPRAIAPQQHRQPHEQQTSSPFKSGRMMQSHDSKPVKILTNPKAARASSPRVAGNGPTASPRKPMAWTGAPINILKRDHSSTSQQQQQQQHQQQQSVKPSVSSPVKVMQRQPSEESTASESALEPTPQEAAQLSREELDNIKAATKVVRPSDTIDIEKDEVAPVVRDLVDRHNANKYDRRDRGNYQSREHDRDFRDRDHDRVRDHDRDKDRDQERDRLDQERDRNEPRGEPDRDFRDQTNARDNVRDNDRESSADDRPEQVRPSYQSQRRPRTNYRQQANWQHNPRFGKIESKPLPKPKSPPPPHDSYDKSHDDRDRKGRFDRISRDHDRDRNRDYREPPFMHTDNAHGTGARIPGNRHRNRDRYSHDRVDRDSSEYSDHSKSQDSHDKPARQLSPRNDTSRFRPHRQQINDDEPDLPPLEHHDNRRSDLPDLERRPRPQNDRDHRERNRDHDLRRQQRFPIDRDNDPRRHRRPHYDRRDHDNAPPQGPNWRERDDRRDRWNYPNRSDRHDRRPELGLNPRKNIFGSNALTEEEKREKQERHKKKLAERAAELKASPPSSVPPPETSETPKATTSDGPREFLPSSPVPPLHLTPSDITTAAPAAMEKAPPLVEPLVSTPAPPPVVAQSAPIQPTVAVSSSPSVTIAQKKIPTGEHKTNKKSKRRRNVSKSNQASHKQDDRRRAATVAVDEMHPGVSTYNEKDGDQEFTEIKSKRTIREENRKKKEEEKKLKQRLKDEQAAREKAEVERRERELKAQKELQEKEALRAKHKASKERFEKQRREQKDVFGPSLGPSLDFAQAAVLSQNTSAQHFLKPLNSSPPSSSGSSTHQSPAAASHPDTASSNVGQGQFLSSSSSVPAVGLPDDLTPKPVVAPNVPVFPDLFHSPSLQAQQPLPTPATSSGGVGVALVPDVPPLHPNTERLDKTQSPPPGAKPSRSSTKTGEAGESPVILPARHGTPPSLKDGSVPVAHSAPGVHGAVSPMRNASSQPMPIQARESSVLAAPTVPFNSFPHHSVWQHDPSLSQPAGILPPSFSPSFINPSGKGPLFANQYSTTSSTSVSSSGASNGYNNRSHGGQPNTKNANNITSTGTGNNSVQHQQQTLAAQPPADFSPFISSPSLWQNSQNTIPYNHSNAALLHLSRSQSAGSSQLAIADNSISYHSFSMPHLQPMQRNPTTGSDGEHEQQRSLSQNSSGQSANAAHDHTRIAAPTQQPPNPAPAARSGELSGLFMNPNPAISRSSKSSIPFSSQSPYKSSQQAQQSSSGPTGGGPTRDSTRDGVSSSQTNHHQQTQNRNNTHHHHHNQQTSRGNSPHYRRRAHHQDRRSQNRIKRSPHHYHHSHHHSTTSSVWQKTTKHQPQHVAGEAARVSEAGGGAGRLTTSTSSPSHDVVDGVAGAVSSLIEQQTD